MNRCDEIRSQMTFYLDDELRGGERAGFEEHLKSCAACCKVADQERRFLESIRAERPLYRASPQLRSRIEQILSAVPVCSTGTPELRNRVQRSVWETAASTLQRIGGRRVMALATATALIAMLAGLWYVTWSWYQGAQNPASDFALKAVDTHLRHLRGRLPLEITSDSPDEVSEWFAGKVDFKLKLPNYQDSSGQEKRYRLEGARLISFRNDYAAYVAYEMRKRPITLVVTPSSVAMPSGGERIVSSGLTFHYDSVDGLKVITWSDRGLTYALVSDLEERGQQSCIVCHAGTRERDFIQGLKPGR